MMPMDLRNMSMDRQTSRNVSALHCAELGDRAEAQGGARTQVNRGFMKGSCGSVNA
jgi:hypothetical protein